MKEILKEHDNAHFRQTRLDDLVEYYRPFSADGRNAEYIPALGKIDAKQLGICVTGSDQTVMKSGDWDVPFTLQSISKVISFIAACLTRGIPYVLDRVDAEPTGDAFNSIIRLEMHKPGKPFNPMINAGALTIASMSPGDSARDKIETLYALIEKMIGKRPVINEDVFRSEWETAHRNRALAYYLKETGFLEDGVEKTLEVYLKQCAMEGNTADIAMIGMILANDGYHPFSHEQIIPKDVARLTKALMLTCGMYNASGKFAAFVGVPAKSGVSGGIMCAVPASFKRKEPFQHGRGIGIYGPAIDEYGNSLTGGMLLKQLAQEWDLSIF